MGTKQWLTGRLMYRVMSICCSLVGIRTSRLEPRLTVYDSRSVCMVTMQVYWAEFKIPNHFSTLCMYVLNQTSSPAFADMSQNPTGHYVIPMIASSYVLAATVCSFGVMFFGMHLGRRMCIMLGNMCVIVGSAIQASAMGVGHIIAGRVICGFGIGFISSTSPTYMAEMSINAKERGPEVAQQCSWLIFGIAVAYWVDFGFVQLENQASWRCPIAFQAIFAIISLAGMLVLPDTPRWYYAQGRLAEGDGESSLVLVREHLLTMSARCSLPPPRPVYRP